MKEKVRGVPEGMHSVTPHLVVKDAAKAIDFYQKAFGAVYKGVHKTPDGKVMHAELKIGDSSIFLADEFPGMGTCTSPQTLGGTTATFNLYTENVDPLFDKAVAAGATVTMPLSNQFWGDRYGQLKDPFGRSWALGQHIEDVAPAELDRRAKEIFSKAAKAGGIVEVGRKKLSVRQPRGT